MNILKAIKNKIAVALGTNEVSRIVIGEDEILVVHCNKSSCLSMQDALGMGNNFKSLGIGKIFIDVNECIKTFSVVKQVKPLYQVVNGEKEN